MQYRPLGNTGFNISSISFGAWAIGGAWGSVDDSESLAALNRSIDLGVNFIDTADVYGDGRSEELIAKLKSSRREKIIVATKAGRRLDPHIASGYNQKNIEGFVDRSLKKLSTDSIDLLQLHCPPTEVYYNPDLFDFMDKMKSSGKIKHYGVSVEKVEEALKAIEFPGVETVQIIFNIFRQRPSELLFSEAKRRNIGILARVPLASGMLTGKMTRSTFFADDDHRKFNRHGESFDRGETFSGVDYEVGLEAVDELKKLCPEGFSLTQFALRWILMFDAISCAIPGAKRASQAEANVAAADLPQLSDEVMTGVRKIYDEKIRPLVHHYW
jgi:aryl-alcohol dehydrogenase-like predicted oxidoreductase